MVSRVSTVSTTLCTLLFIPYPALALDFKPVQSNPAIRWNTGTNSRDASALAHQSLYADAFQLKIQEGLERSTMNISFQPGSALSLRARYLENRPKGKTPLHDTDPVGAWNVRMGYSPQAQPIAIYGEADFSRLDAASGAGVFATENHNLNIGLTGAIQDLGALGKFSYGSSAGIRGSNHQWTAKATEHRQAAGFVDLAPGKYGARVWGAWKTGYFKLLGSVNGVDDYYSRASTGNSKREAKTSLSLNAKLPAWPGLRLSTELFVDDYYSHASTGNSKHKTKASLSLNAKLPAWPRLSLSTRLHHDTRRMHPANGVEAADVERIAGLDNKVTLDLDALKLTLSSRATRAGAFNATGSDPTQEQQHSFGASYRPLKGLSIESSFSFSRHKYAQLGTESHRHRTALSVAYKPPLGGGMDFSMYGSYAAQRRSEWSEDAYRFKLGSSFDHKLKGQGFEPNSLSLRANYDRQFDPLSGRGSRDDFSLWLVVKVGADRPRRASGSRGVW